MPMGITVGADYLAGDEEEMRMLWAYVARAARARSQSGSDVRRTNELCASHVAVHDGHVRRYDPPE